MRRRDPRPLAVALGRLTAELAPPTLLAQVQRAWGDAAPQPFGTLCEPVSERDGRVTVACPSSVVAQELHLFSEQVVERLNACLGRPAVSGLRAQARPAR